MIIFIYAMKQLGAPIVSKRALNTKIQNVMTLCLALYSLGNSYVIILSLNKVPFIPVSSIQ